MNTDPLTKPDTAEPVARARTMLRLLALAPIVCGVFAFAQPQPESVVIEDIMGVGLVL